MGMIVEFNWFMVVASESKIVDEGDYKYTIKSDKRIYPIGFKLPLIVKNLGCVGMIKVIKTVIGQNETKIYFELIENFDKNSEVAQHYFERYLDFKNRESELNP